MPVQAPNLLLSLIDMRTSGAICIRDLSTYYVTPDATSMQITPPGYDTINVPFTVLQDNIYTCTDLATQDTDDCCSLPDGIYSVVYTVQYGTGSSAEVFTIDQRFIKIDNIKCCYQKAFLKVDLECGCTTTEQDNYLRQLDRIKLYIDASVAQSNMGNYRLAHEYYTMASNQLNKIKCKFPAVQWNSCGCNC